MGWSQYNALLNSKTVLGDEDDYGFRKSLAAAGSLVAGGYYDFFEGAGMPAANVLPTGSNAFVAVSGNNNAPTHNVITGPNPAAGKTRHLLYAEADTNVADTVGSLIAYDLEGFYPDFDLSVNSTQVTGDTTGTNRLTRYSGNKRVQLGLIFQTTPTGADLPEIVINYVDQDGNAGATGTLTPVTVAAGALRGRYAINSWKVTLAAGDTGVRAVVSVVTSGGSGGPTGKVAVFLMRKLGEIPIDTALETAEKSFCDPKKAFLFPRLRDNFALNLAFRAKGVPANPSIDGTFYWADGANP